MLNRTKTTATRKQNKYEQGAYSNKAYNNLLKQGISPIKATKEIKKRKGY